MSWHPGPSSIQIRQDEKSGRVPPIPLFDIKKSCHSLAMKRIDCEMCLFHSICLGLELNFLFTVLTDLVPMPTAAIPKVNIALGRSIPSTVSDSFFISLTAADYSKVAPEVLRSAASNADTLEFRVDLLENWEPENVVHQARTFVSQ